MSANAKNEKKNAPAAAEAAAAAAPAAPAVNVNAGKKKNNAATAVAAAAVAAPAVNANAGKKKNNAVAAAAPASNASTAVPKDTSVTEVEAAVTTLEEAVEKEGATCGAIKPVAQEVVTKGEAVGKALNENRIKENDVNSVKKRIEKTLAPIGKLCKTNASAAPAAAPTEMKGGKRKTRKSRKSRKAKKGKSRRRM